VFSLFPISADSAKLDCMTRILATLDLIRLLGSAGVVVEIRA
jgi:hypothetical protein